MASTADCKTFLVDFVKANPSIVLSIYGYLEDDHDAKELIESAANPKNWKRRHKCKPGGGLHEFDEYGLFSKTTPVARMGYQRADRVMPKEAFVSERGFELDPTEGGVAFVVLEDAEGNLYLGNYIGD